MRSAAVMTALALAGCMVGPNYKNEPVVPAETKVGSGRASDSARVFFDSLAKARAADSLKALTVAPLPPKRVMADSIADLAWLEILNDTVLTSLVNTAVRQNRDLAVARARITEFRAEAGVAAAPLYPSVSLNAGGSKNKIAIGSFPPVKYDALRVTGDVAWELDFWGLTRRGMQAANADAAAQAAAERGTVLSLVSDVATGYLTLLELDQEQAVSDRALATRTQTLDLARQRYQRGLISELDVRQFEAQVAVPAAQLARVQRARAETEHAMNVLLGEGPRAVPRGGSLSEAARAVNVPDSLPSTLLARRPDVHQAEENYIAANARIGVADAARFPAFSIGGSYGRQSTNLNQLFIPQTEIYQLQAGVSLPLFQGGALSEGVRAARARAEQARGRYEQTVLDALRDAGDALAGIRAARDQVLANETQTIALRRAFELADLRYRTGVSGYLEVLEAQRGLFLAEIALSQAELEELTAAVRLYKALGGSWVETK
jgi:multidrug efflux system outer membrane protein